MSNYGNLDNAGSGFSLDSNADLESLLSKAASASEDDEGDSIVTAMPEFSFEDEDETPTPQSPVETESFSETEFEEGMKSMDDFDFEVTEPETPVEDFSAAVYEPEFSPKPEPEPEPVYEVPVPQPEPAPIPAVTPPAVSTTSQLKGRVHVPTEEDQRVEAARIIQIIDTYRKLSDKEKGIAVQFVTNGMLTHADDATLVVKVLNADPALAPTMKALCEAYEAEPVERAFYTMSLSTTMLHELGSLVSVFTQESYDTSQENLIYSREIVKAIAGLGETEISYVRATESVLAASEIKPVE